MYTIWTQYTNCILICIHKIYNSQFYSAIPEQTDLPPLTRRKPMSKKTVVLLAALVFVMGATMVFAQEDLPVPKERYLIAFSNGEMSNSWRWAFVDSMQAWANKFRKVGPGIEFIWTNGDADAAKQLMDADTLLAQQPDILILSPFQDEPLDPIIDMATEAGVPLMVIDRALVREPGEGTYFTNITQNFAFSGMHQAMYALEHGNVSKLCHK